MSSGSSTNSVRPMKCLVCGDLATKLRHSHYKATSCFSCRAFFRRSVARTRHLTYKCARENKGLTDGDVDLHAVTLSKMGGIRCKITKDNRKKCQSCRFKKCLSSGMSHPNMQQGLVSLAAATSAGEVDDDNVTLDPSCRPVMDTVLESLLDIDLERESWSRMAEGHEEVDDTLDYYRIAAGYQPSMALTTEEEFLIDELVQVDRQSKTHLMAELALSILNSEDFQLIRRFVFFGARDQQLDVPTVYFSYFLTVRKLTKWSQLLPAFEEVAEDPEDKKSLLLCNMNPMVNIRAGYFFQPGAETFWQQLERMAIFDFSSAWDSLPRTRPAAWNKYMSSPWACSLNYEDRYSDMMKTLHKLRLDDKIANIMTAIALFSVSKELCRLRPNLVKRSRAMQFKFSLLLHRYLMHSRGAKETQILAPTLAALQRTLREMSDILEKYTIKMGEFPSLTRFYDKVKF